MRHRILGFNGLGNPEPTILNNNKKIEKSDFWDEFLEDATKNFKTISEYGGFDFQVTEDRFMFGIEPSYEGDDLQIVQFNFKDKSLCCIEQGRAFGAYGSDIVSKFRYYGDYKNKSKFVKFIDKWYDRLFEEFKQLTHQHEDKGE